MRDGFAEKLIRETLADCESLRQMVESLIAGRAPGQRRKAPRFPTLAALFDQSGLRTTHGSLYGLNPNRPPVADPLPDPARRPASSGRGAGSKDDGPLQWISDIRVINFSEEGLQVELQCDHFFQHLDRPVLVQFKNRKHAVNLHWYKQTGFLVRCGCSFCGPLEHEPELASTLLGFSNELVRYLGASELQRMRPPFETVFSSMSIIHNLRLKFLDALTSFQETKRFILQCLEPKFHRHVDPILREFLYSGQFQISEGLRLVDDPVYKAILQVFLLPSQELGCGLLGVGEQALLLRDEVLKLLMNCLLPPVLAPDRPESICDAVKPVYRSFLTLRERLPGVFSDKEFDRQFQGYSALIGDIVQRREQLIDTVSGVGIHWT